MLDPRALTSPEAIERSKNVQLAMAQFEQLHAPVKTGEQWSCKHCNVDDWPCQKMELMMLIQGFAAMQAMIPSGNMGALIGRFAGGGR